MPDVYHNYIRDLGLLIREQALASRNEVDTASDDDREFALGQNMSYYSVISLMLQQATAFDLAAEDIGLADIDPERDLLLPGRTT
jgi:hypothetical protein